jgi:hypothetical protein
MIPAKLWVFGDPQLKLATMGRQQPKGNKGIG